MSDNEEVYGVGDLMEVPEGYYQEPIPPSSQVFTMGSGREIMVHLVGNSPTEAHTLWNGAKIISDYFESDPSRVQGKRILELGAASGLPCLVAGILGAERAVMTDYPDHDILEVMQRNIDECSATFEKPGHIAEHVRSMGFIWGRDPEPLLDAISDLPPRQGEARPKYDVLILADLLFRHSEHSNIVKSVKDTLRESPDAVAYVFFTSYRPWKRDLDLKFFDTAREAGLAVEQVLHHKLEQPLFENDPGDLDIQKTVSGYEVRWPKDVSP